MKPYCKVLPNEQNIFFICHLYEVHRLLYLILITSIATGFFYQKRFWWLLKSLKFLMTGSHDWICSIYNDPFEIRF